MSDSKHVIAVTVPEPLHAAVKTAADMDMSSVSDWLRRLMLDELRDRGLDPRARPAAASAGPQHAAAIERRATA